MRLVKAEEVLQKQVELAHRKYERERAWMAKMHRDVEDDTVWNAEHEATLAASKAEGEMLLAQLRHRMEQFSAREVYLFAREDEIHLLEDDLAIHEMDAATHEAAFKQQESQIS